MSDHTVFRDKLVHMEGLWQPLYDTWEIPAGESCTVFFQSPDGRSIQQTNLQSAGHLLYPKRFLLWGIEINFLNPVSRKDQAELAFQFIIGEAQYFCSSLLNFREVEPGVCFYSPFYDHGGEPITKDCYCDEATFQKHIKGRKRSTLLIPPLQNFRAVISTSPNWDHHDDVKVQLIGELFREIA